MDGSLVCWSSSIFVWVLDDFLVLISLFLGLELVEDLGSSSNLDLVNIESLLFEDYSNSMSWNVSLKRRYSWLDYDSVYSDIINDWTLSF